MPYENNKELVYTENSQVVNYYSELPQVINKNMVKTHYRLILRRNCQTD